MTYSQAATNDTSQGRRRSGGSPRGPTIPRIESRSWTGWKSRVSRVVTEWSYRDLRSQGLRTRLAQRGPDKLLAAGKTLSLSLSLSPRPFFKGVTTHVAATCSPLDWPRQHLRTVQYWNFQLCCVCRSGRAVEGEVLEFWTSFEEEILNRGEIILNFFQTSNLRRILSRIVLQQS